jgi:ureidoglycolate hydrolase
MANKNLIQIHDYTGDGYQPLVTSSNWRVAKLNFLESLLPARIEDMERHLLTDEVFVLLKGRGVLILGSNTAQVDKLTYYEMEFGKIYNVAVNTWHTILLSRDASVLIVENSDTGEDNSETLMLNDRLRKQIETITQILSFSVD